MMKYLTIALLVSCAAAPVAAQNSTEVAVCKIAGSVAYEAMAMRQAGLSQRSAANILASKIGAGASNGPGSQAQRQYLASLIGGASTDILRVVYSLPVRTQAYEKVIAAEVAGDFFFNKCMRGDL